MKRSYRKFMDLIDHWANHGVPQMLGTVVSMVAIGIGISMFVDPAVFIATPSFRTVFWFASPFAWGTVYIVAAMAVLIAVYTSRKSAQAPVFMLGATFCAQGLLQLPPIIDGNVPSGLFMYIGIGWICLITQLVCSAQGEVKRETSSVGY